MVVRSPWRGVDGHKYMLCQTNHANCKTY